VNIASCRGFCGSRNQISGIDSSAQGRVVGKKDVPNKLTYAASYVTIFTVLCHGSIFTSFQASNPSILSCSLIWL
jgi:hypothetical protein